MSVGGLKGLEIDSSGLKISESGWKGVGVGVGESGWRWIGVGGTTI